LGGKFRTQTINSWSGLITKETTGDSDAHVDQGRSESKHGSNRDRWVVEPIGRADSKGDDEEDNDSELCLLRANIHAKYHDGYAHKRSDDDGAENQDRGRDVLLPVCIDGDQIALCIQDVVAGNSKWPLVFCQRVLLRGCLIRSDIPKPRCSRKARNQQASVVALCVEATSSGLGTRMGGFSDAVHAPRWDTAQ
jgi:hypothetical protein